MVCTDDNNVAWVHLAISSAHDPAVTCETPESLNLHLFTILSGPEQQDVARKIMEATFQHEFDIQ